jgi:hypothetical protein
MYDVTADCAISYFLERRLPSLRVQAQRTSSSNILKLKTLAAETLSAAIRGCSGALALSDAVNLTSERVLLVQTAG